MNKSLEKNIYRPSWKKKIRHYELNLSRNVHFDENINNKVNNILKKKSKSSLHYADPYLLYKSISKYYKIPLKNLTIGFGATEILNRLTIILNVDKFYILDRTFEMFKVYCDINSKKFKYISKSNVYSNKRKNSAIYIVNPNGVDGSAFKIDEKILKLYKYVIIDEVYSDFFAKFSYLNKNKHNLVVVKSLSKSLGIAGLRVGFCKASVKITKKIQSIRLSQVCNSYAALIVPKIISSTKFVIKRMNFSKKYLEKNYECKKSFSNYVLFKKENNLTKKFGSRKIFGFYRMALTNIQTIKKYE